MRKTLFLIILFVALATTATKAQREHFYIENAGYLPSWRESDHGAVVIHQDIKLRKLMQKRMELNNDMFPGWRVQIYFGAGQAAHQEASDIKEKFYTIFGQRYGAYIVYNAPYFKVRVGDFRTKAEAMSFRKKLKSIFKSTWIIQDIVNYPDKIE